jgi:hypothetical protein
MIQAGFADAELVSESGFNSSDVTRGVLIRASKSASALHEGEIDVSREACRP